ncbi:MAG: amidase [Hyphomicrobiales bacterium]
MAERLPIVDSIIKEGFSAIAEKEHDIKAFAAQKEPIAVDKFRSLPLSGLPVGVKDIIDTADMPTQHGSPIYKGNQPKADAAIVSLIRRAGGQVLHKTVTTEFAFLTPNITTNPHNITHTPGGSSSGSAAAVAAGMLPFAIGTQTGGSIVRPASYCGVFGFKPSFDSLPTVGTKAFSWSLDTLGFLAPSVPDMQLLWSALMQTAPIKPIVPRPLTIGVAKTALWHDATDDIKDAMETAAEALSKEGASLVHIEWPELFDQAFDAHQTIHDYECCRANAWEMDTYPGLISPMLMETLQAGLRVTRADYVSANSIAASARDAFAQIQETVDVILTPPAPSAAPATLQSTGTSIFNRFLTLMGVPCMNLPAYVNSEGLPIGIQLVGRKGEDDAFLALAHKVWRQL